MAPWLSSDDLPHAGRHARKYPGGRSYANEQTGGEAASTSPASSRPGMEFSNSPSNANQEAATSTSTSHIATFPTTMEGTRSSSEANSGPENQKPFPLLSTTPYLLFGEQLANRQAAVRVARLMTLTHNTISRAFNAVYNQAENVDPQNKRDVTSFAQFAIFAIDFLQNHHRCEELVFFPMLEAQVGIPGTMDEEVEEHEEFKEPLIALREYLEGVRGGASELDAGELRDRIDALAPALGRHLRNEIFTILEAGASLSDEAMTACYKALHDEAERTTDPIKIGPLVMGCQDNTMLLDGEQIQFPELPFALAPYAVEYIISRRYADVWRFCPSTFHGEPRESDFRKAEPNAKWIDCEKVLAGLGSVWASLSWTRILLLYFDLVVVMVLTRGGHPIWKGMIFSALSELLAWMFETPPKKQSGVQGKEGRGGLGTNTCVDPPQLEAAAFI